MPFPLFAAGGVLKAVASFVLPTLLPSLAGIARDFRDGKISEKELDVRLEEAALDSFARVEESHGKALAETFGAFMDAASKTPMMARVWAAVTLSQLAVLLWHQVGIPAIVAMGFVDKYPPSGSTVEWAYLLVGGAIGLGPLVLKGTGAANAVAAAVNGLTARRR